MHGGSLKDKLCDKTENHFDEKMVLNWFA